ncbi:DNA mismatch repair protein MutS [Niabella ginsenosidivorans]|uniref:DNA mismatch repair protein MutS n=1 Tax=Niabella ginsenosidivorans TaxID=1176587 RepID=A0A1A9I191_9BACT|nr:DNA mismatch repair protein MutS [Niabella ginsenosidivorans]ANH80462.1 DNA mismatch repair protein MutS [Niabella ginsenosidivorans]
MQIDHISFNDIAIFHEEEEYSIFHKLNFTRTFGGREWLRHYFSTPFSDITKITGTQNILKQLILHVDEWPEDITNGTILVMDRFLDYALDKIGNNPNAVDAIIYRIFHHADYTMARFSISHFSDFFRSIRKIADLLRDVPLPATFKIHLNRIDQLLKIEAFRQLSELHKEQTIPLSSNVYYAGQLRLIHKREVEELMDIYSRLDAWYSMAMAVKHYQLSFPVFVDQQMPMIEAEGLYHILLQNPVPYNLDITQENNFLFLTGANMAGKSTLIKSVGASVFLAHIGMGVPAQSMRLTLFDGLISNINVVDNIVKGESYFFNEVQRIKNTVEKISNGQKWLVLIDELFKGTNVQDAMRCSLAVIKGLLKVKTSLFVLSTHLYEIGEDLEEESSITFRHFETTVTEDTLSFSYQLKEGISKDRLGYFILKKEKVIELLDKL